MFAPRDALAGADIKQPRTYSFRIIRQLNSVIFTRTEPSSWAHVLKRISIGGMVLYRFKPRCVEVSSKTIPSAENECGIQKNRHH